MTLYFLGALRTGERFDFAWMMYRLQVFVGCPAMLIICHLVR